MPINQFAEQINNFAMAPAGSRRIFQLLSEEEEVDKGYVTLVKGKEVMVSLWSARMAIGLGNTLTATAL